MKRFMIVLCVAAVVGLTSAAAQAAFTLFDRGLPGANLNNAAGANRSNVTSQLLT